MLKNGEGTIHDTDYTGTTGAATPRQQNPQEMDDAIGRIQETIDKARCLLHRIDPPDAKEAEETGVPQPVRSLKEILSEGPERIRSACEGIDHLLDQIEERLF